MRKWKRIQSELDMEVTVNNGLGKMLARANNQLVTAVKDRDWYKAVAEKHLRDVQRLTDERDALRGKLRLSELQNSKYRSIYSPGSPFISTAPMLEHIPTRELTKVDIHG